MWHVQEIIQPELRVGRGIDKLRVGRKIDNQDVRRIFQWGRLVEKDVIECIVRYRRGVNAVD